jgi:DNA repair protein RadA/Sms
MNMLLAVLEKRAGFKLARKMCFHEYRRRPEGERSRIGFWPNSCGLRRVSTLLLSATPVCVARLGYSGEIRPVNRIVAAHFGSRKIGLCAHPHPSNNLKGFSSKVHIEIQPVKKVTVLFSSPVFVNKGILFFLYSKNVLSLQPL